MSKPIRLMVLFLLFLLLGVLLFTFLKFNDTRREASFANHAAAAELQKKGWLPALLGPSATEIYVLYDLDTNRGFGCYLLPQGESLATLMRLRPVDLQEALQVDQLTRAALKKRPSWWPAQLEQQLRNGSLYLAADQKHLYAAQGDKLYFWLNL